MDELELLVFKEFIEGKIQADKLELDERGFYKIGRFQMKQLQIIGKKILNELEKKDKIIKELLLLLQKPSRKRKNRTMNYIKTNKANKFGVNGVCQDMRALKRTGEIKYRAYITLFGKQHTLGTHDTLESAIQARKNGEEKVKNILKNLKYKESED